MSSLPPRRTPVKRGDPYPFVIHARLRGGYGGDTLGENMRRSRAGAAALCVAALVMAAGCEAPPSPWTSDLVSIDLAGNETGDGASFSPVFSPDGTTLAFVSAASDLVGNDTNGVSDVYLRDLATGATTLLSTNAAGSQAADGASTDPVFSPDGTKLAFTSQASDLGVVDTNGEVDVYVRDLTTGETVLASAREDGAAVGVLGAPVFAPDGTKLAFATRFPVFEDLEQLPDGLSNNTDVFVRDLAAATTTLVSVNAAGTHTGNADSSSPQFSPDGSQVAFASGAGDLGPTDTNRATDIYLRDLSTGVTSLVTVDVDGTDAAGGADGPFRFSPDGATVYFTSSATNLVALPDANGVGSDVFARDLIGGTTALITANGAGTSSADGSSRLDDLSADGTTLAFTTTAGDLGPADANGRLDVYVRDLRTGATSLVSASADGSDGGNSVSHWPRLSADGTRVAFVSHATDLGPHDSDGTEAQSEGGHVDATNLDVYVRDLESGVTAMASTDETGTDSANENSGSPVISPDGTRVAFVTSATDLGYTDLNANSRTSEADVYVATFQGADLGVTLVADDAVVAGGAEIAYRVALTNAGPDGAEAVALGVVLPEQVDIVEVSPAQAACTSPGTTAHVLVCQVGSLEAGRGAELTITVAVPAAPTATLSTVAIASSPTVDPDRNDNLARVDVAIG